MTKAQNKNPRNVLDETASSIRNLILELEDREIEGRPMTATEIQTMASRLQGHLEDLLAASKRLRDEKSGKW
jgi:hypothetical protein